MYIQLNTCLLGLNKHLHHAKEVYVCKRGLSYVHMLYIHIYVYMYIYTYTYTYIHAYMYIQPNTRRKMREHVLRRETYMYAKETCIYPIETYMYAKETCLYVCITEHTHRNAGASTQTGPFLLLFCYVYIYTGFFCIYIRLFWNKQVYFTHT